MGSDEHKGLEYADYVLFGAQIIMAVAHLHGLPPFWVTASAVDALYIHSTKVCSQFRRVFTGLHHQSHHGLPSFRTGDAVPQRLQFLLGDAVDGRNQVLL